MTNVIYKTLYSKDTSNNVRVWYMERDGDKYRTVSGLEDGQHVASDWRFAAGKNIGKINETTPEEQAHLEVESNYRKKLRMKYFEKRTDIDGFNYIKPMLAHDFTARYTKKNKELIYPVISQPKLDGIRCLINKHGAWSRTGKEVYSIPHILTALEDVFTICPELVIDGELYNHDLYDNFNKITSIVRKTKIKDFELKESEKYIQYHIYDCIKSGDTPERIQWIQDVIKSLNSSYLVPVQTDVVDSKEGLDELYSYYMEIGYEGQMVRLPGPYEQKRSTLLLKRKEFDDTEFPIIRIEEGQGNWAGYAKRVFVQLADGSENGCGIKGSQEYMKEVLDNKELYVGKQATVRYQGTTPDGKLRFPVVHQLHLEDRW